MRLARDRPVFLCLAAIDDIRDGCAVAPADPSLQFRAVLAMLYELGNRDGRALIDAFWRASRLAPSHTLTEHQANHRRVAELARLWPEICRSVGVDPTADLTHRLAVARHGDETDRERLVRYMRENEHRRRVFGRHRRQKQQCTITG